MDVARELKMPTKQIYFIRHGETEWNAAKRFQGHTDIPLSEVGKSQAQSLRDLIPTLKADRVISSDLIRAIETAKIACEKLSPEISTHPELREIHLGDAEGVLQADLMIQHGEDKMKRWFSMHPQDRDFRFSGGETKNECVRRVKGFLEVWFEQQPHANCLVVFSHGAVIRNILHSSENSPAETMLIPNCVCQLVEFDSEKKLWTYIRQINSGKSDLVIK